MKRVLGILLATVTCHSPPPRAPHVERTFRVDGAFTTEQILDLQLAAATWTAYTRGTIRVSLKVESGWPNCSKEGCIVCADSFTPMIAAVDETLGSTQYTLGRVVYPNTALLAMDRLRDSRTFYEVAVHEIGHMLGMGHTEDPRSIMYPVHREGVRCPKKADMVELCRVSGCDLHAVTWCE